jgi:uncharacterized protein YndB with AHSA1/START domain
MQHSAQSGFLVVADITGYSTYLSHSELEHATNVLKALLDLLIDHAKSPLVMSGLEGDAVLSYTIDSDRFEGQAFVELIEQTYVAFKRAIDLMVMNTSCACNACANINALDLKFFVHHGEFIVQELAGRDELVGTDVNLIHRLMKNSIIAETGISAYTFFTSKAVDRLAIDGLTVDLTPYHESFPDVGEVRGWVLDMGSVWESNKNLSVIEIDDKRAISFVEEYPLTPAQVWGYLTNPDHRAVFSFAKRQVATMRRNGRVGPGTIYECFHMDNSVSTNTVLEWQPFSRIVTENTALKRSRFLSVFEIQSIGTGTRVTLKYTPLQGPLIERMLGVPIFFLKIKGQIRQGMVNLRELIDEDIAAGRVARVEHPTVDDKSRHAAIAAALESND